MSYDRKWTPKDDEIEEEEEEEDGSRYQDQKDAILFAIHVSDSMLKVHSDADSMDVDQPKKKSQQIETSAVRTALECAYSILQSRIISSPNDMMGILLFGTKKTKVSGGGNSGFHHCYLLMDLDVPDAPGIKQLKQLLEDEDEFNSLFVPSSEKPLMANVLFCANQIFTTRAPNFHSRKLFIITDDDDPHVTDKALKNSAITRARDLYDLGVRIDPFYISYPEKTPFDPSKFYDDIVYRSPYDDGDDARPLTVASSGANRLKEMVSSIRSKATPKRALFSCKLEIGPGLDIGVKGFLTFKRQEKGRSHYVYTGGEQAQLVQGTTTNLAEDTAQVVEKTEIKKAYKFGGEQVIFTQEEMKQMRNFGDPVIRIIGFKPATSLPFDHNVKPASFIYPDEKDFVGSTRTFTSLHTKLVTSKKIGIAWAITRRNVSPILCALYPSEEELSDDGKQLQPPGFFLIQLPFADDMRQNPGTSLQRAPASLVDLMRVVVKQLHLPRGYEPEKYSNPSLQWHYRILQAMALEEDLPEKADDKTKPKYKLIDKHAGQMVLDWGEELEKHSGVFRVAADKSASGKRMKVEDDGSAPPKKTKAAGPTGVEDAYAKGTLGKMTVAALKEWCKETGLETTGKKADLVERVEEYLDRKN